MKSVTSQGAINRRQGAFTLIEIMVTVAIAGILAAIALPSYFGYLIKSDMRAAQADLLALSLAFENRYQRTLAYPVIPVAERTTVGLKTIFTTWSPGGSNFDFSMTVSTAAGYTLTAVGTGRQAGCTITLTNQNGRTVSAGCKYPRPNNGNWI